MTPRGADSFQVRCVGGWPGRAKAGDRLSGLGLKLAIGAVAATGLVACGGPEYVSVVPPEPTGVSVEECADLLDALPRLVLDGQMRDVEPRNALAAAWGDPAVVLRCGVERPAQLEPSSPCLVANDVGWFTDEGSDSEVVFTTIGRSTYVEVTVPDAYPQPGGALAELAQAISGSTTELQPCV